MKVHGFLLGTRVGRVLRVKVFRVMCRFGYMKGYGFLLGARVGGF